MRQTTSSMRKRAITISVFLSFLMSACSRERPTLVTVNQGPSFALAGSGRLAQFTIYVPLRGQRIAYPDRQVASVVWQITASGGYFEGARANGLLLTYGTVPNGYGQTVPQQAAAAPQLSPGVIYSFFAETTNAPVAGGYFYLSPSGPIQTLVPDLCLKVTNGHESRVKCGTEEPYQEPIDLEGVAYRNRVQK